MKWCNKCEQWKDLEEFSNHRNRKDGKQTRCKECESQHHKDNRKYRNQLGKQHYKNNREYYKQLNKQNYKDNREHYKRLSRQCKYSLIGWSENTKVRQEIEKYEDVDKSVNNNLMCKCTYCGDWFEPTRLQINHRLRAINGEGNTRGECRLYCCNKCKENCPIYGQSLYEKGQKSATSREVQPQLRQLVFQRDNYTCQKCINHKDNLEIGIHCHHILPLNESPIESADKENCITLCESCHNEVHQIPGCTYNELRCQF